MRDRKGNYLHYLAENFHADRLNKYQALLKLVHEKFRHLIHQTDLDMLTPLDIAVREKNWQLALWLFQIGSQCNSLKKILTKKKINTNFLSIVLRNNPDLCRVVFDSQFTPLSLILKNYDINERSHCVAILILIKHNADMESIHIPSNKTCLQMVIETRDLTLIKNVFKKLEQNKLDTILKPLGVDNNHILSALVMKKT